MPDQMSLPGVPAEPALFQPEVVHGRAGQLRGYNLFFALVPLRDDAEHFAQVGAELRRRHGLRGPCLPPQNLHVSLHAVAGYANRIPRSDIDAARAAAARVTWPGSSILFDRACSFNTAGNNPFVLRCDAQSDDAVTRLRDALGDELRRAGLRPKPSRTPHMTLLYDSILVPEHLIEQTGWIAARFTLILSHQGRGHHERLGDWPPPDDGSRARDSQK